MIVEIVADLGYLLLLLNIILFTIGFSNKGKAYRIFLSYLIIIFFIQIIAKVFNFFNYNNLFLSHFYFVLQFILLSYFYLNLDLNEFQKKTIKMGFLLCLSALTVQYFLDRNFFTKFNLFEIFITSFLLIIYATFYLYNLLNERRDFYYVNLGVLIYLFGSTVIFLAGNLSILYELKLKFSIWVLNALLYVIYQLFIFMEWKKNFSEKEL